MQELPPNELNAMILTNLRKLRVLSQKAIARMYAINASKYRSTHDRCNVEIILLGRRRAYTEGIVGEFDVQ